MLFRSTVEIISEECGDSPKQVQRYISLTKLIPEFLQKLDEDVYKRQGGYDPGGPSGGLQIIKLLKQQKDRKSVV